MGLDGGRGLEAHRGADLADRRGEAVLALMVDDDVEDLPLTDGELGHWGLSGGWDRWGRPMDVVVVGVVVGVVDELGKSC
jgi:hypothetical protein